MWTKALLPGLPSRYTFTSQYSHMDDPTTAGREGFGLMFYQARWYDPGLGRFAQADSIIPEQQQGTQAWDRFAYVNNSPLMYNDPTGHVCSDPEDPTQSCESGAIPINFSPPIPPVTDEMLGKIRKLAGGDNVLIEVWYWLYQTKTGHDLAMYILENNVAMRWGGDYSNASCDTFGCYIYLASYGGSDYEKPGLGETVVSLGHEAFHIAYGEAQYREGSLFEEYWAYQTEDYIRQDLAPLGVGYEGRVLTFDGYDPWNEGRLRDFIKDNKLNYWGENYPPYPSRSRFRLVTQPIQWLFGIIRQ